MARIANKIEEIRILFARTGNRCAYPECNEQLIDQDDVFLGEVCHIEAANVNGARFNPDMSDEERRSTRNLIVLCPNHHTRIDKKPELYDVDRLKKMKEDHERQFTEGSFQISNKLLQKIFEEQLRFQRNVNQKNADWRAEFAFAMELELSEDPSVHLDSFRDSVSRLENHLSCFGKFFNDLPNEIDALLVELGYDPTKYRELPYYKNPFDNCFWEYLNIGVPNILTFMRFHSTALEEHIERQKLKDNPNDKECRKRLGELRSELSELASTSARVD